MQTDKIEEYCYNEIFEHYSDIIKYCNEFSLDYKLVISIIYTERCQYGCSFLRRALKGLAIELVSLLSPAELAKKIDVTKDELTLSNWVNHSRGFSHIKMTTLSTAYHRVKQYYLLDNYKVCNYTETPSNGIYATCIILRALIDQWEEYCIESNIPVLATLFNISNFTNKLPHPNPRVGGSVMPTIIDSELITDEFGTRVTAVYHSKTLEKWCKNYT